MTVLNFTWTHKSQKHNSIGNLEKTALLCFRKDLVWKNMEYLKMKLWSVEEKLWFGTKCQKRKDLFLYNTSVPCWLLLLRWSFLSNFYLFLYLALICWKSRDIFNEGRQWQRISATCFLKDRISWETTITPHPTLVRLPSTLCQVVNWHNCISDHPLGSFSVFEFCLIPDSIIDSNILKYILIKI